MDDSIEEGEPESVNAPEAKPFPSVFWDDLEEDLKDPEFARVFAEEYAKARDALK